MSEKEFFACGRDFGILSAFMYSIHLCSSVFVMIMFDLNSDCTRTCFRVNYQDIEK